MNNPELGALHRELVMSGQITEAEFWDGREVMSREYDPSWGWTTNADLAPYSRTIHC